MYAGAQSVAVSKARIAPMPTEGRRPERAYEASQGADPALSRSGKAGTNQERKADMLYTIAVVLIILWLLGLVTSTTMGGFVHVLLVIAIVVVLLRVISGRKPI